MNKYEILDRIGQGQYGVVLKGKHRQTGELVAIKKFKQDDSDQQNKRVILRQVKILKTLRHDNIIQLKQAFRKKGKIYLVCEYVQKNLLQILQQGPVMPQSVKHYAYNMLKGIAYMHHINVIHRDIKPQNVLIGKTGSVKICDLGFARTVPHNNVMTDYVATRWYRPPQLLIGRDDYDKSIDVWSVGCVMAQTIDGEPLFAGQNDLDQLYLIQKCLGPLTAQHQQQFLKNPKFIGMKFPQIHNLQSLQRRYFGKIQKQGLDLLKQMLKMQPSQRITAQQALKHPFFQKIAQTKQSRLINQIEQRKLQESYHQFTSNNSNNIIHQKSPAPLNNKTPAPVHLNNFMQQKNKGVGLQRSKKQQGSSLARQNLFMRDQQQQPKGKSVGNKKLNIIKQKYGPAALTQKQNRGQKNKHQHQRKPTKHADQMEQYYEQKWQEDQQEETVHKRPQEVEQPVARRVQGHRQEQSPAGRKEQIRKSKIFSKNFRKQGYNIVFNNNTYNVNLGQPHH